ncbi:MAG: hypothetical protein MUO63_13170 [Desulfobulbaceae bacterium]|nr:hypothetical protein [Desulfobulbaceae bacterium]
MGKLSRLRLKQQSDERKREEGVVEAELAILTGCTFPWNGKNGSSQADGNDIPPAPSVSRRKRKSG